MHTARTVPPRHVQESYTELLALLNASPSGSHSLGTTELRRLRLHEIQDAVATGHTPPHALRTPAEAYAELSGLVHRAIPLEVWNEMRNQRYRRRAVQDVVHQLVETAQKAATSDNVLFVPLIVRCPIVVHP